MSRRLILFDIDGTLIATNYAGRQVMSSALTEVFGSDGSLASTSFSGKTDMGIITSAMADAGFPRAAISAALTDVYEAMTIIGETIFAGDNLIPCPGILPLLSQLRSDERFVLGLQTGNIRSTALQKLRAAGIDPAWFPAGAFGSDSVAREELLPVAWRRARRLTGDSFSGHNTIVVGDTPGDVQAAKATAATSLAVATGFCPASELAQNSPDYLLPDLSDTSTVMKILSGGEWR